MRQTLVILTTLVIGASAAWAQDDPFRAPCDQAAANLAASKHKEVVGALEPLLKDAALAKSPNRDRLCYYLGCAAFALESDLTAGRALSRLAPFDASPYGPHARYLLARVHHRAGEYTEAFAHYEAVLPGYEKQVAAAKKALAAAKPEDKPRLEALVKGPPPDFVSETLFHAGVVLYEQKAFPEAVQKFALFAQKDKRPVWLEEARLRSGMSQARMGQNAEALKTLQPLQDHPKLARTARWWMARAILSIPEAKPADAAEHLKKASAAPEADPGPSAAALQLALGEALDRAGKPAESVEVYKTLQGEEPLARLVGAHAAAKQYREAEEAAARFEKQYPGSALLGDVLLRRADASFAEAQAANKPELFAEALKRYERVLGVASGVAASAARYRTALLQYRLGKFAEALENLRGISEQDRSGELSGANLLHGECILRLAMPAEDAADAVTAAKLLKDLLEANAQFGKAMPSAGAQAPEIMMKLAHTYRQVAVLLVVPADRAAAANAGRELYEAFRGQFPNHALRPVAEYERANCFVLAGDSASGMSKLERFRAEPFVNTPVAPLANLRHAQLLRAAGQPAPAARIPSGSSQRHEAALLKDPARVAWVPLIRYHHAAALKELKQLAESAKILESVVKDYEASEWAEPSRRLLKEVKP